MFWHAGFPALVVVYANRKSDLLDRAARDRTLGAIALSIALVAAATAGATLLATAGAGLLPPIMEGNRYTAAMLAVVGSVWTLSALALLVLWRKRPHTVLDLWLMVVLCAWVYDIGLAAVFNGGRYDLGFYAGRVYGLLAACFVLVVLLVENALLYRRLLDAYEGEQRERQRAQATSAELAAANKELDAFSYSVSHDLRAPLRSIDGYGKILEEDYAPRLDDEGRRLVGVVRSRAGDMNRLIDGLLEFSRLGRREPARERVAMTQVARAVAAELAPTAPAASVRIAELPDAHADPVLIRQVWANLIGNALKYSSKRTQPQVEVGAREEAAQTVYWVRDNGAGFDMQYAERLFGVFQRLHSPKEFPGTGVGLATVQRIVQRHGGRVWAESRPDAGATFSFSLPLESVRP
jgi:signal transduction histidine kinase